MSRRPVIGITTQTQEAVPGKLPPTWIMGHRYITSLTSVGALPWVIPLIPDDMPTLRGIYEQLDGVFLPGGVDMDPSFYGEEKHELCGRLDPDRDRVETTFARWALADHKPIFGVCRGIQVMNVAAGGSLFQDVKALRPDTMKHDYYPYHSEYTRDLLIHDVQIEPQSRLARVMGATHVMVNSMHHQGIKDLARGFIPTSYAPDGLIESIEAPNGQFAIGVQWHPEELLDTLPHMRAIFLAFLQAAVEFRSPSQAQPAPLSAS